MKIKKTLIIIILSSIWFISGVNIITAQEKEEKTNEEAETVFLGPIEFYGNDYTTSSGNIQDVVNEAIQIAFMKKGYQIASDPEAIANIPDDINLSEENLSDEEILKAAKSVGAEMLVYGYIYQSLQGFDITVKAVSTSSGEIIYKKRFVVSESNPDLILLIRHRVLEFADYLRNMGHL